MVGSYSSAAAAGVQSLSQQPHRFNLKTGIQHELSDREFTYTERDLSGVRLVPSAGEMLFQFDNAPEVERSVTAPKTNFFAMRGLKSVSADPAHPLQEREAISKVTSSERQRIHQMMMTGMLLTEFLSKSPIREEFRAKPTKETQTISI